MVRVSLVVLFSALFFLSGACSSWAASYNVADGNVSITSSGGKIKVSVAGAQRDLIPANEMIVLFDKSETVTTNTITVENAEVKITLSGVKIDVKGASAFGITGGASVDLTLSGDNTLKSGRGRAGLEVGGGDRLIIRGGKADTLTAEGGEGGAGIGSSSAGGGSARGIITISGGTVTAIGGGDGSAGLGGGFGKSGETIIVNGGTLTAIGGEGGAGIGSGGGCGADSASGSVTINGGTVIATGGGYGSAGIGGGQSSNGGAIAISGGTITATGGSGGAGIGGGLEGSGGATTISGGTVRAAGVDGGAGIGGGKGGSGGAITISGGTVTTTGGKDGMDIGPGLGGSSSGAIIITGGTVHPMSDASKVSPLPVNGTGGLAYQNTLKIGNPPVKNTGISACAVDGKEGAYGIKDVHTDKNGNVYFWLPAQEDGNVTVQAGQESYGKTFARESDDRTEATLLPISASTDPDTGTGPDTDTGTESGAESGTESGTDSDSDSDSGADTGTDSGSDTDSDSGADTGTDSGSDTGTDSGSDTDSDSGADTGTDSGSDTDSDSGADTGTDSGSGSGSGSDTGSDSGMDTDSGSGSDSGSDTGMDSGTDAGTDSDSGSDTGTDSGSDTGTGSGSDAGTDSDSGSDTGTDSGMDTDSDSGMDTDSDSGSDTGTDSGMDTDSDSGSDTGTDSGTDSGSGSDAGTDSDSGSDSEAAHVSVSGVTLLSHNLILATGQKYTLHAPLTPDNATDKGLTWSSGHPEIATVDEHGVVWARKLGKTTITVRTKDGGHSDTCAVTVTEGKLSVDLSVLNLKKGILHLTRGQFVDVTITTTPAGALFKATGLPDGLTLSPEGRLSGAVDAHGDWRVTLTAVLPDDTPGEGVFIVSVREKSHSGSSGGCETGVSDGSGVFAWFAILALSATALEARRGGKRDKNRTQ